MKRKSSLQLEALEKFYAEQKYPTQKAMKELAVVLELTYKQVRGWFIEKRRRDKSKNKFIESPRSSKKLSVAKRGNGLGLASAARRMLNQEEPPIDDTDMSNSTSSSDHSSGTSDDGDGVCKRKKKLILLQDMLTPDYILTKIFRKDGPSLGVEFDSLPRAFRSCKDVISTGPVCEDNLGAIKRRKVVKHSNFNAHNYKRTGSVKKHGMGKGLMTVWRAINPNGGDIPIDIHLANRRITDLPEGSTPILKKQTCQNKRRRQSVSIMRKLANKLQEKRKPSIKRREVVEKRDEIQKQPPREKCELALEGEISEEHLNQFSMLADDEELELRELHTGSNPIACSDHCATGGRYGCSLCKDLLPKFPPDAVKMKQPLTLQPWNSSPDTVKKLFKVFHFLYTYSVTVDICPFTLDEFAQAFRDKESLLLGKIHVALLKLLLSDVETEISTGLMPHLGLSCNFLALLHSVENQEFIVEFWKNSLNPLTWTEILRQVLVAAGFGSKQGAHHREALSKEMSLMVKYGLRPGTLKGELFKLLLVKGNVGLKVSELAKSSQIAELDLAGTTEELELRICSTLSSDITLFEKISSSAYRLRINTLENEADSFQSDTEDSGSVHDDFNGTYGGSDSECDSEDCNPRKLKNSNHRKGKNNQLTVYNEIDESHPGEVWLLGLMEGEYSDLSIEEKLSSLVALIDLLSSGPSIRMKDPKRPNSELVPNVYHYSSGGKIKKGSLKQHNLPRPSWVYDGHLNAAKACTSSESHPIDSSMILKNNGNDKLSSKEKDAKDTEYVVGLHAMQSVFLGSDRRYNRYWLFLGPCTSYDPGHKRLYFESSEDGHWEVIDTEEALQAFLSVLDDRGRREAFLIECLEKREASLRQEMSSKMVNGAETRHSMPSEESGLEIVREASSSPVSDVDNLSLTEITKDSSPQSGAIVLEAGKKWGEENQRWINVQEFDAWIWNCFYCNLNAVKHSKRSYFESLTRCETCHDLYWRDEKHCRICHMTFELDFDLEERYAIHLATCRQKGDDQIFPKHKVLPSQLQSLKAAVHAIESVMPEDALVGAWRKSAHKLWIKRLRRTSSLAELLRVVADFVAAINEDWLCQCHVAQVSNIFMEEIVACFPTMPQTSSALALWLVKLDDLISPYLLSVQCEKKQDSRAKHAGKTYSKL